MRAATLTAHVQTWRPYTLWYPGLVSVGAAALTAATGSGPPPVAGLAAAWLVPTLIWAAAHYLGDYLDRHVDAIDKPQRPIPSGRMRPRTALVAAAVLVAAAAAVTATVNWLAILVLLGGAAGVAAYSGIGKARGLWGNLARGAVTALALVFGTMTVAPHPPVAVLPFVVVFWAHDAATNLVGTLRDVHGDRAGGYATVAVRHGIPTAARAAAALYGLAAVTALAALPLVPERRVAYLVLVLAAVVVALPAFTLTLAGARRLTPRAALWAHEVLVAERIVLACALLAPAVGMPWALGVLAVALALTLGLQAAMRSAHEADDRARDVPAARSPDSQESDPCAQR